MTLVIDPHPFVYAAVMGMAAVFFLGLSLFLVAHYGRRWRRATDRWKRFETRYRTISMAACSILVIAFTAMGWFNAHPHTVVLGDDAIELQYVWSSCGIPYSEIRRIDFGVHKGSRGAVGQSVTLSTADASFDIRSEVQAASRFAVRTLFDELTRRVPGATVPPESKTTWQRARDQAEKRGY